MLTNEKPRKAILLFMIAFLFFLGCNKMENETPSSLMMTNSPVNSGVATKSCVTISTTGFPMIDLGTLGDPKPECAYGVNSSGKVVGTVPSWGPPLAFLWSKQYGVKYLGTLGNAEHSFSMANDINDHGEVVGCSWMPLTIQQRAFVWNDNSGMVNLGTFGDFLENSFSMGFGINNRGEIVGVSDNLAFLWTKGQGMVRLGTLGKDERWGAARDINDIGQIVGMSQLPAPESNPEVPWTWKWDQYHAVLWTSVNKILDLGTLKLNSQALGINNKREIVGGSSDKEGWTHERIGSYPDENGLLCFDPSCVAFVWTERHGMTQLPILAGGNASSAHAINDKGQVVGWSFTKENKVHAFVWTSRNGIKDLGTLPGAAVQESVAYNINNPGQVAGYSIAKDGTRHAVIWTVK